MKIRKANLNDLERILILSKRLFEYEIQFTKEFNQKWTYSKIGKDYFINRLTNDNSVVLVIEESKKIAGYILVHINNYAFRKNNPIAEIENMFIEEKLRGKGAGKRLVKKVKKLMKERKVSRIKVGALSLNKKAIAFYKKIGFSDFESILEVNLV